jgi:hypothetical protein
LTPQVRGKGRYSSHYLFVRQQVIEQLLAICNLPMFSSHDILIVGERLNSLSLKRTQLVFKLVSLRDAQKHEVFQQPIDVPSRCLVGSK